jgi:hypothetical protein
LATAVPTAQKAKKAAENGWTGNHPSYMMDMFRLK